MIEAFVDTIADQAVKDAFRRVLQQLNAIPQIKGTWRFIEIPLTAAVTNRRITHGLGFRPKDVIHLSNSGGATVTYHYDSFTRDYIQITTSAATTIRALVGSYQEV